MNNKIIYFWLFARIFNENDLEYDTKCYFLTSYYTYYSTLLYLSVGSKFLLKIEIFLQQ